MTNKLKEEKSPYLKQHKDNPVNWFAWNKESLEKAKKENQYFLVLDMRAVIGVMLWLMKVLKMIKQLK